MVGHYLNQWMSKFGSFLLSSKQQTSFVTRPQLPFLKTNCLYFFGALNPVAHMLDSFRGGSGAHMTDASGHPTVVHQTLLFCSLYCVLLISWQCMLVCCCSNTCSTCLEECLPRNIERWNPSSLPGSCTSWHEKSSCFRICPATLQ